MMEQRHKKRKSDRELWEKEKAAAAELEKKKEKLGIIVPMKLFEDIQLRLATQIPYTPHGEESSIRDPSTGNIVKKHVHHPDLPFDKSHDLWHLMEDLKQTSAVIDLGPVDEHDEPPELTSTPETAEHKALRLKREQEENKTE